MKGKADAELRLLLAMVDQAFDKPAWHGPNLRNSLRGLSAEEAAWRPAPGRHNIWEIAVHAAYWKYVVRRRLLGDKDASFPLKGSDWFARPQSETEKAWNTDLALLEEMHAALRKAIQGLAASELHGPVRGSKQSGSTLVTGIASHDLYHAGQIRLLRRLQGRKRVTS